jgi:polysaccharide export outer membrane protein
MEVCTPSAVEVRYATTQGRRMIVSHGRGRRGRGPWRPAAGLPRGLLSALAWMCLLAWGTPVVRGQSPLAIPRPRLATPPTGMTDPNALSREQLSQLLRARTAPGAKEPNEPNEPNDVRSAEQQKRLKEKDRKKEKKGEGELSRIEALLAQGAPADVCDVSLELKQFGYEVFRTPVSTFAPVTNVPVGPDYILGPGDSFTLTLWGRVDGRYSLRVDREGQIILPEVGALKIWGMKFGEMKDYLQHELSRKFTDFKLSVTMDRLRTIQVVVLGEAVTPGTYTVSSLSTVINALCAAGGPSKNGSLRKIRLSRGTDKPMEIDLYDFLMGGDKSKDLRLQDGDAIFIPLIGPIVGLAGHVKRPAIYEMLGPTTLGQALEMAGGATFTGWLQRVQVQRVQNHQRRVAVDFDMSRREAAGQSPVQNSLVQDGDVVKVFGVAARDERVVHLEGHVVRPGKYEWRPGLRLRDILPSYDLLLPQPNTEHGEIIRLVPPDLHPTTIPFHPGRLLAGEASENLELAQYDTIRVFRWDERISERVTVSGMVYDANDYRLVPDMRVYDLIEAAGGLQKNAYLRTAEITRQHISQDGVATEKIEVNLEKALAGDPENNILLRDYDYLVIRPIPELEFGLTAEIVGEVRFPGVYPIRKQETLSSLIERAGGYTEQAYLPGAVFTRQSAKDVQRRRLDELISQVEESTLSSSQQAISGALDAEAARAQEAALATKKELLAKLRTAQITGRVVVKVTALEEFRGSKSDLELENGDKLVIPQMPGVVYVVGEVFNPASLLYERGETVHYYLDRVGGMTRDADKKQVSVIRADGSVISMAQSNRGPLLYWDKQYSQWSRGGFMNQHLDPGDTIVVPRKIDKTQWLRNTKDITQILFQIAVAAGVVLAL